MSKLEIEFELTGLKLKVSGDSDHVSDKVAELQRQVHRIMNTIGGITQGAGASGLPVAAADVPAAKLLETTLDPTAVESTSNGRKQRGPRKGAGTRQNAEAVDFKHDAETYGFPKQEWNTAQKAMWLLNALAQQTGQNEYSASVIAATFNKHFKSFGTILAPNVHRDLGKEKGKSGWVNSDASQDPQKWYLLESGKQGVAALIQEAKVQGQPAE